MGGETNQLTGSNLDAGADDAAGYDDRATTAQQDKRRAREIAIDPPARYCQGRRWSRY